jgi:hypothetical protein
MITTSKVQDYIDAGHDEHEVARWLINLNINKYVPMELDDLADTSTVANEVDAIVECIQEKDYQDAINIAEDSAVVILEDEGFDVSNR